MGVRCVERCVPRPPAFVVDRPALIARLDTEVPVALVRGGAGTGKTVLLAQWAREQSHPVVWWQLREPVTADEAWRALLDEVTRALPPDARQLRDPAPEVELAARLAELSSPLRVAVDGADHLPAQVLEQLAAMAQHAHGLVLRLTSRSMTVLETVRIRLQHDVDVITDLMLTRAQTAECLTRAGVSAATSTVRLVHRLTGGLPVAVGAIAVGLDRDLLAAPPPDGATSALEAAIARLLQEVLAPAIRAAAGTPTVLDAFRRAAVAEVMTEELAQRLTDHADLCPRLDAAARAGLGEWIDRDGRDRLFRFLPVVRLVLLSDPAVPRAERQTLRKMVAEWAIENGDAWHALRVAALEGDARLAEWIVVRAGRSVLLAPGTELTELLAPLPRSRLRDHPVLLVLRAVTQLRDDAGHAAALELLDAVAGAASAGKSSSRTVPALDQTARAVARRLTGHRDQGVPAARSGIAALTDLQPHERSELANVLSELHNQQGLTLLYSGRLGESVRRFEQAFAAARVADDRHRAAAFAAAATALTGNMPRSTRWSENIETEPTYDHAPQRWALLRMAAAIRLLERDDLDGAEHQLGVIADLPPPAEPWAFIGGVRAWLDLCRRRPDEGLDRLVELRAAAQVRTRCSRFALHLNQLLVALMHVALGDPTAAADALDQTSDRDAYAQVTRARVQLAGDEPEQALSSLLRASIAGLESPRLRAEHAAVECAVLLRLDLQSDAARILDRLWSPLHRHGLRLPLALSAPQDLRAIGDLAEREGRPEIVDAVARTVPLLGVKDRVPRLTPREVALLSELAHDGDAKDIASRLHVSVNTVKTQRRSLYRKLGVSSRLEAMAAASAHRLLTDRGRDQQSQG